jgi:hypothetical protein
MQQPVVQFGTAIYGEGFSGGALDSIQKPVHVCESPLRPELENSDIPLGF